MKTFKLASLFMLLSLLSMGMGFPDIVSERDIVELKNKKQKETVKTQMMACSREIYVAGKHKQTPKQVSEKQKCTQTCPQPKQVRQMAERSLMGQAVAALNNVFLRVFDIIGNVLLRQQIHIGNFLSSGYAAPNSSDQCTFVMDKGNPVYYFQDSKN